MSGYKHATVTISQEEYRRLQEADMRKRFKEYSRTKVEDSGQNEAVLNLMQQLEERERQLRSALDSLSSNAPADVSLPIRDLLEQNSIYYERLVANLWSTKDSMQSAMDSMSRDFISVMQSERESLNQSLQSIILEQNAYHNDHFSKAEAAQQWLYGSMVLVEFIQTQFDHGRFTPGKLNRILRSLNLAEDNLVNGLFEASIQVSQQMYLELSDLNFELENIVMQWQTMFERIYYEVDEIIYQMVSNGKVQAVGLNGEMLPDLVDLSYWTNGRYLQLLEHTRQLAGDLLQDQDILTFEDLDRIENHILPVIRESFENTIVNARLNALNSQLRMNIAEKALQALENHGYSLDHSGYANNDMRSQFNAHLASPDGSQVVINVLPDDRSAENLSNELVVITTHPELKTEHEARIQWEELSETLRQYKLQISRPEIKSTADIDFSQIERKVTRIEQQNTQVER